MSRDNSYRTGGIVLTVAVLAAIGFFYLTTETGEAPVAVDGGAGAGSEAEPSAEAAEAREIAEKAAAKLLAEKLAAEKATAQLAADKAVAEEAAAEQAATRKAAQEARAAADRLAAEKAAAKLATEKATAEEAAAKLAAETAAAKQAAAQKAAQEAQAAVDKLATENAAAEVQAAEVEAARAAKLAAQKAAEVAVRAAQAAAEQAAVSAAASKAAEQARAAEEELTRKVRAAEALAAEQAVAAAKAATEQAAAAARIATEEARRANDARIAVEEAKRVEEARIAAAEAAETARAEPEPTAADEPTETPKETEATVPEADPTIVTTDIDAPSFDLVRIAPDGGAVIAGRAQPNETVDITANGQVIGTARANARGEFVALLTAPPSEKPLSLALIARSDTGEIRPSAANVLILSGRQQDPDTGDLLVEAPIILRETADSFEIVQPAPLPVPDQVVIDAIGYDRTGAVEISGRGRPTFLVRLYMNGRFVEQAEVDETGVWSMKLRDVEAGRYTLRVDEVDSEGRVASRAETPFQRIFPDQLPDVDETTDGHYTVQPGNNLWTIARNHYGEGLDYWQIFYANKGLIRDPDLIYPGQIFVLPDQRGVEN